MANKNIEERRHSVMRARYDSETILDQEENEFESEEQIWEDVMSGFFPNAESEEEIEEELDNMFND